MLCETGLDQETLSSMCEMFILRPEMLYVDANQQYAQCCQVPIVDESIAICGTNLTVGGVDVLPVAECHKAKTMFNWDQLRGINIDLLCLVGDIILYVGILLAIEIGLVTRLRARYATWRRKHVYKKPDESLRTPLLELDSDVKEEKDRIEKLISNGQTEQDVLIVSDLVKTFGHLTAVKGLNFGVHHGECFGLLGINGAGKTTTFRYRHQFSADEAGCLTPDIRQPFSQVEILFQNAHWRRNKDRWRWIYHGKSA